MVDRHWDAMVRLALPPGQKSFTGIWAPPEPIFFQGLRVSEPIELRAIRIGCDSIAVDAPDLVRGYPEYRLHLLEGAYTEWRPTLQPAYLVELGLQVSAELVTGAREGWVEPIYEYRDAALRRIEQEARRKQKIADCLQTLSAPAPKRFGEEPPGRKR
ncbi:MAG TPA: hypothetical protein VGB13_04685 [Candidatus Krumholzibacteria bacterium]